jgi:hypothetical protein
MSQSRTRRQRTQQIMNLYIFEPLKDSVETRFLFVNK